MFVCHVSDLKIIAKVISGRECYLLFSAFKIPVSSSSDFSRPRAVNSYRSSLVQTRPNFRFFSSVLCSFAFFFISQTKSSFQIQGKYSSSQSREATSVRVASFRESSKVRGFSKCAARLLLRYIIYDSQLIIFGFWCSEMEDGRFQISLQ